MKKYYKKTFLSRFFTLFLLSSIIGLSACFPVQESSNNENSTSNIENENSDNKNDLTDKTTISASQTNNKKELQPDNEEKLDDSNIEGNEGNSTDETIIDDSENNKEKELQPENKEKLDDSKIQEDEDKPKNNTTNDDFGNISSNKLSFKSETEIKIDAFNNNLSLDEKISRWNQIFASEEVNQKLQKVFLKGSKLLHFFNFLDSSKIDNLERDENTWNQLLHFLIAHEDLNAIKINKNIGSSWNHIWKINEGQANSNAINQIIGFNVSSSNEPEYKNLAFFDLYSMFSQGIENIIISENKLKNKRYDIKFIFKNLDSNLKFFTIFVQSMTTPLFDLQFPKKEIIFTDFFYDDFNLDVEKILNIETKTK